MMSSLDFFSPRNFSNSPTRFGTDSTIFLQNTYTQDIIETLGDIGELSMLRFSIKVKYKFIFQ